MQDANASAAVVGQFDFRNGSAVRGDFGSARLLPGCTDGVLAVSRNAWAAGPRDSRPGGRSNVVTGSATKCCYDGSALHELDIAGLGIHLHLAEAITDRAAGTR
jgi:hypothetical protein